MLRLSKPSIDEDVLANLLCAAMRSLAHPVEDEAIVRHARSVCAPAGAKASGLEGFTGSRPEAPGATRAHHLPPSAPWREESCLASFEAGPRTSVKRDGGGRGESTEAQRGIEGPSSPKRHLDLISWARIDRIDGASVGLCGESPSCASSICRPLAHPCHFHFVGTIIALQTPLSWRRSDMHPPTLPRLQTQRGQ